jgi:glucan 1,6-alpha-isomaltosidase
MVTRRNFLKGSGIAATGLGLASLASCAATVQVDESTSAASVAVVGIDRFRRGGTGPLYWSTYGYNNATNAFIPEDVWSANIDWIAESLRPHGYRMVCTDGWVDYTQNVTSHGYIKSYNDSWLHDWAWWAKSVAARGLELGVYYNPLWVTKSAVRDPSVTVVGRPDVKVADIVNAGDYLNSDGELYWVDVTRDGAEEYVTGYVEYFRELGAALLRVDFLGWYEIGFDQSEVTEGVAHGRDGYLTSLGWMREAAGDMILSLVMPNLFDHGAAESQFGDLIRIDNDVSYGGWPSLSEGRQDWQPIWSQWNNPFTGFTGFSDISGRGRLALDGDPLYMSAFDNDDERQTAINLFTMAGAAIAIADQHDTIGSYADFFTNSDVLAVRQAGLVGKPIYNSTHGYFFDPTSRDTERWIGQLPDGTWVVGLFNRDDGPGPTTKTVDFASELGISGPAKVYDLWGHAALGSMTGWNVSLRPHASALITVTPQSGPHYQAYVGAWSGTARFENTFAGHEGLGYVTGLDTLGSSITIAVAVAKMGSYKVDCNVANATGSPATLDLASCDPVTGRQIASAHLVVPSTDLWTAWQSIAVTMRFEAGDNLVVLSYGSGSIGSVNVDYVATPTLIA